MSGWNDIRAGVAGQRDRLIESLQQPDDRQLQRLLQVVERNRDTEFGRKHGFAGIRSIQDFQQQVPLRNYDDCRADINRMMAGEDNILVADDVLLFETTGGSAGGSKHLPFTASFLDAVRTAILPWLDDLITSRPGITKGSAYWAISPALRQPQTTPAGAPIGLTSDAAYFGENLAAAIVETLAVPPSVAALESFSDWQSTTLQHLAASRDLSFISVWSPTFLLQLLDAAAEPIEWPMLDTISCWCSSTSERYAAELQRRFPGVHIQGKGLLATEGVVTIPLEGAAAPVLAIDSGFYEFESDNGDIMLPWELETGHSYNVVMTTDAGLYRYRIGDRVRVVAWVEASPCLEFIGRTGADSDLCGEKLSGKFVEEALGALPGFAYLVPLSEPHPAYLLVVDAAEASPSQARSIADDADQRLMKNPQYKYARDMGQLAAIEARSIENPIGVYKDVCRNAGQVLGDIKPVAITSVEWGERFFRLVGQ